MNAVFLEIVNRSLAAGWLILAVLVLRLLMRKAPKWISCVLWGLVAVRLVCPIVIESPFSLMPKSEPIREEILYAEEPMIESGTTFVNDSVNSVLDKVFTPEVGASVNPLQIWVPVLEIIWFMGMLGMLLFAGISYQRLRKRVRASILLRENILICDEVQTPFILGIISPRIFLPSSGSEEEFSYVLAHEKAHIRRRDHWWKPLGFLLLSVFWISPLCWAAYVLFCRDIELACDERVIREYDLAGRKAYSTALLSFSVPHAGLSACPLAFGEVGVKERVRKVLRYKKPLFGVVLLAVAACIVTAACFLTNPQTPKEAHFQAKVIETYEGAVLVEPLEGSTELLSSDRISVSLANLQEGLEVEVGDVIEIFYSGEIMETYPAQLGEVYRIVGVSKYMGNAPGTDSDVNSEIPSTESEDSDGVETPPATEEPDAAEVSPTITFIGMITDGGTIEFKKPSIQVKVLDETLSYDYVCFVLPEGLEEWGNKWNTVVEITCADVFEETEPAFGALSSIREVEYPSEEEESTDGTNSSNDSSVPPEEIKQDSRGPNGEPSMAYIEVLQENISQAMMDGELPFVAVSAGMENPNRLQITVTAATEENIAKLKSFETMGEAIEIVVGTPKMNLLEEAEK